MQIRGKIISLDIGTKRIGVASCDPLWITVSPLCVIERNKNLQSDKITLEKIEKICIENNAKSILIGVPYNMDGTLGPWGQECIDFIKPLAQKFEILYHDERLTSFEAEEILKQQGKKYTKNKGLVDMQSACLILKEYIEENYEK